MFESYWMKTWFIVGVCSVSFIVQYIVSIILKKMNSKFDNEFLPFIQRVLGIAIWCVGLATILFEFGVINIMNLVTTAGIGSILIAMLIKDSVSNIVAGMTLMFDRPFRVGDNVKLSSGDSGKILKIGLRRTQILIPNTTEEVSVLVIPNKDLAKAKVYNYTFAKDISNEQKEKEKKEQEDKPKPTGYIKRD